MCFKILYLDQAPKAALAALESIAGSPSTTATAPTVAFTTATVTVTPATSSGINASTSSGSDELLNALQKAETPAPVLAAALKSDTPCKPGQVQYNVTLKGGRKSGDFVEQKGVATMTQCAEKCCSDPDKKCNLAFMLGTACYSVKCAQPALCRTVKAPPTKFYPNVQYVRGLDDSLNNKDEPIDKGNFSFHSQRHNTTKGENHKSAILIFFATICDTAHTISNFAT